MANIRFNLKSTKRDKEGKLPILVRVHCDYKVIRKHLSEKIKPQYWNENKQRVRISNKDPELNRQNRAYEINELLDSLEKKMKDYFNDCYLHGVPIKESQIKQLLAGKEINLIREKKFFDAFDEFIESSRSYKAERTIKGYTTVKKFLDDFQEHIDESIEFERIDLAWFDKLKNYAFLEREKTVNDNYFSKIVAVLKTFLNWAKEREYYRGEIHKKFSAKEREKDVIYLTMDELMRLFKHPFEKDKHRKVRDIYCFGCFTGLRISDIQQLKKEYIRDGFIYMPVQKTQQYDLIPLNKFASEILERNADIKIKALPPMSVQKVNKYIKECCEIAEINEPVSITSFYGGQRKEDIKPKHKLITMHTARKTFVTNSLMLGMNVKTIKDITGHKKDSTFNKYLKIAEQYKKSQMEETWNKVDFKDKN